MDGPIASSGPPRSSVGARDLSLDRDDAARRTLERHTRATDRGETGAPWVRALARVRDTMDCE